MHVSAEIGQVSMIYIWGVCMSSNDRGTDFCNLEKYIFWCQAVQMKVEFLSVSARKLWKIHILNDFKNAQLPHFRGFDKKSMVFHCNLSKYICISMNFNLSKL